MRRVFAGDRRVWLAGGAVLLVALLLMLFYMLRGEEHYTGTNSVGVRSVIADVPGGGRLCVPDLEVPAGTGRVQLAILWREPKRPALRATLRTPDGVQRATVPAAVLAPGGPIGVDLPFRGLPSDGDSVAGRLCVSPEGGSGRRGAGRPGSSQAGRAATIDGEPLPGQVAIRYLPPADGDRSLLTLLDDAVRRAALFRPDWAGAWLYAAIFLVLLPGLWLVSLRLLATRAAGTGGVRAAGVALVAPWRSSTRPRGP